MSEIQEVAGDDKKIFLRSHNNWKIGEKLPVSYAPPVEGMVVASRWIANILTVVFLSPPYAKPDGTWAEASVMYKTADSMVKKPLSSYEYPFPTDPRILEEVKKANGNLDMLQELAKYLNKSASSSFSSEPFKNQPPLRPGWDREEVEGSPINHDNSDRLSLHLLLSQTNQVEPTVTANKSEKLIEKLIEAVHRLSLNVEENKKNIKKAKKQPKTRGKNKKSSTSSSSTSSVSDQDEDSSSSSDNDSVRSSGDEDGKGWFSCPFSVEDIRTTAEPRKKMKGKLEERKYLRKAMHNIYSEYSSLKTFVETIRSESLSSASRPFNSDLIWLTFHATYLDSLLLNASMGPWALWNELGIDHLMKSFLELLVRSSSNRAYPEILDERVRKWMKRKRIGLSAQFGAIPSYLVGAKITDSGIHPKGGWEAKNFPKNTSTSSASSNFKNKSHTQQHVSKQ